MAVTIVGNSLSTPLRTVGRTIEYNEDGQVRATLIHIVHKDNERNTINSFQTHPDYSFLGVEKVTSVLEEGEQCRVTHHYAGVDPFAFGIVTIGGGSGKKTYRRTGSLSQTTITNHPKFFDIAGYPNLAAGTDAPHIGGVNTDGSGAKKCGIWQNKEDATSGDITTDFIGFTPNSDAAKSILGLEAYLEPGLVWEETIISEKDPNVDLEIGIIDDNVPEAPSVDGVDVTRNWLRISASQDIEGSSYRTVRQWQLSGIGGHNQYVYDPDNADYSAFNV